MTHLEGLAAVAEAFASNPRDAYWGRRFLEELRDESSVLQHRSLVAPAFVAWASHDPGWFVSTQWGVGLVTHCFVWPKDLLEEVELLLILDDESLRHLILGRLWWAAKLLRPQDVEFARRTVAHFRLVEERHRSGKYQQELAEALVFTNPAELEARADAVLASVPAYGLAGARQTLLEGAARASDWAAYDRHREVLRHLRSGGQTGGHEYCSALNLDGLTALARGREDALPSILAELVECGRNVEFLGTPDTIRLPQVLIARGEHLTACREYLRVFDAPHGPVLAMLAQIDARLAAQATSTRSKTPSARTRTPAAPKKEKGKTAKAPRKTRLSTVPKRRPR